MLALGQYGGVAASGVFQNRDLQDYEGFTGFGRCVASLGGLNMDGVPHPVDTAFKPV